MKTLLKANDSAHTFGWSAVARKAVPANGANQDYIYVSIYDASGACLVVGEAKTIEDAREYMKHWSFNDSEIELCAS